jgi:hypothetical protein
MHKLITAAVELNLDIASLAAHWRLKTRIERSVTLVTEPPDKQLDGTTHLKNLFLCGTDQGFVGIIGAIVSGISIANMHCLRDA